MIESCVLRPAMGATVCHSSSVMNGISGWARRSTASSAHQGAAGAALLGFVAGLDFDLGDFQIPVAELVPDELVNGLGDQDRNGSR